MTLSAFIFALFELSSAHRLCGCDPNVVERARDLTLDKFGHLPSGDERGRKHGPDCRTYFASVLAALAAWANEHPIAHAIELEAATAGILQRHIQWHVRLSCKEARRSCNPMRSRFAWTLPNGTLHLWIPTSLGGTRRRRWLEENIPNPDASRPDERQRVQFIIDEYFGVPRVVRLPDDSSLGSSHRRDDPGALLWDGHDEGPVELGEIIAEEKAQRIHELRTSIRIIGPVRLRELIVQIFRRLANDDYDQKEIAAAYQLKQPSLSRFAGKAWEDLSDVPDLWVNTARVLAGSDRYVEAAIEAGVWDAVCAVLEARDAQRDGNHRR